MSAAAAPAKKKATKPKKVASHPTYQVMIAKAVAELKERGGSSKAAILKYIMNHFKVGNDANKVNAHLKLALRRGVAKGGLKQTKGKGASGSFKLGEKKAAKKPRVKKAKKPKAAAKKKTKKVKKPAAKKAKVAKPKPAKKAKSPKKAKAKKPKSPKKAKATKPKASKPKAKKSKTPKKAKK